MLPERFFSDRFRAFAFAARPSPRDRAAGRVDDADIYLEYRSTRSCSSRRRGQEGLPAREPGGRRARQSQTRTGYAHTDEISLPNLEEAARSARAIADRAAASAASPSRPAGRRATSMRSTCPDCGRSDGQARLAAARRCRGAPADPRVSQVIATLASEEVILFIATAAGWTAGDVRPLTRLNVTVIAEEGGTRELGTYGGADACPSTTSWTRTGAALHGRGRAAGRAEAPGRRRAGGDDDGRARSGLAGHPPPRSGGHGLEGDFNARACPRSAGGSAQKVASELVSVVDDGTLPNRRGSLNHRRRGHADRPHVLIEQGVLCGYMQDRLNAP